MEQLRDYREAAELTEQALRCNEYEAADRFLCKMLYESTPEIAKEVLCERNMVLKVLTEILLCEKNRGNGVDSWKAYHQRYEEFFSTYQTVKRHIRRIWFGFDEREQEEINDVFSHFPVSSDLLAVIAKYSVPPEYWGDTFERLQVLLDDRYAEVRDDIDGYLQWMQENGLTGNQLCHKPRKRQDAFSYRKVFYQAGYGARSAEASGEKIAVIFCTNDEGYAAECRAYFNYLSVPEGMTAEIIEVWNAPSMAAGYNFAMSCTDAKYKLYIHHDTFLLDTELLLKLVRAFQEGEKLGLLGIFGTTSLPGSGRWYQASHEESVLTLWQDAILNFLPPKRAERPETAPAEAIDGAFLATSADIPWREDIFDDWHFYDISQCFEMKKAGYEIALMKDREPWALHESTLRKDPEDKYGKYCEVFRKHYL